MRSITRDLVKACIANEKQSQKQLYQLLVPYLRAIATRYLRDTSYIKDALQESFVRIFNSLDKYDFDKAPLKKWAAKITINQCLNLNTRVIKMPNEEFIDEQCKEIVMPAVLERLSNEDLLSILKKMPTGYFEIFNLHVIDGYAHKEIATMLNIKKELSRQRLARAKNWIKKALHQNPGLLTSFNSSKTNLNKIS